MSNPKATTTSVILALFSSVPTDDVCELSNLLQIHDKEIDQSERQLLSLQSSIVSQEERHVSEIQSYQQKLGKLEQLQSAAHSVKQNSDLFYAKSLKLHEELKEEEKLDALHAIYSEMEQTFSAIKRSCDENTDKIIELTPAIDDIASKYCLKELKRRLEAEEKEQNICEENLLEDKKKLQVIEEKLKKLEILLQNNDAESLQREIINYRSQQENDSSTITNTISAIDEEAKRFLQYENSLNDQLREMETKNMRLQSQYDAVVNLTTDLESIICKNEGSNSAASSIITSNMNQENEWRVKSSQISESLRVVQEDINKYHCDIAAMKVEESSVKYRLEKAEFAINSFLEKRNIELMLSSTSLEVEELTQTCESVEARIKLLRETGLEGHSPSTYLHLNNELNNATKRLNDINESIKEKESQNIELEKVCADLTVHKEELQSRNKELTASMEDVQNQLLASQKEISDLRRSICQQYQIDENSLIAGKKLVKNVESVTASIENMQRQCEFHDQLMSELKVEIEKLTKQRDDVYINLQNITQKNEESYNRESRIRAEADVQLKISRAKEIISGKKSNMIEQMRADVTRADEIFQQEHLEAINEIATKKQQLVHTLEKLKSEESAKKRTRPDSVVSRSKPDDYSIANQSSRKQSYENLVNTNVFDVVTNDLSQVAVSETAYKHKAVVSGKKFTPTTSGHAANKVGVDRKAPFPTPQVMTQSLNNESAPRLLQTQPSIATPATGYRRLSVSKNVALTDIMKKK